MTDLSTTPLVVSRSSPTDSAERIKFEQAQHTEVLVGHE